METKPERTWSHEHLHTVTFRYPKDFRKAVAASLGRLGETATLAETETFIREAVNANVAALIEEHLTRRSVLKVRVAKRRSSET